MQISKLQTAHFNELRGLLTQNFSTQPHQNRCAVQLGYIRGSSWAIHTHAGERANAMFRLWPDNQPHGAARAFGAGGELEKRLGTDGGDTSDRPQRREMIWASIVTLRTLRFLREHLDVSWLVGCLAWQVASARREWHQHHRTTRRRTKAKLRLSVTPHGPRRPRKGPSRAVPAQFVFKARWGISRTKDAV